MTKTLKKTTQAWKEAKQTLSVPRSETEYDRLVSILDELIDKIGNNERHPLARLAETIATLIEAFENEHVQMPEGDAVSILRLLMEEHGLKQTDMKEIGSQGIVSEVLGGKRKLNTTQIKKLAKRFHVSPAVFID
ncbi:hypothetical protein MNBD_NITROSPINAE03-1841 [hydrothermal vent metagenome]|uniref:HTH cro/C1-type domain-containing protein n=1 Tax=hydrothermal vent metagenome TaxID=652676 RepID=A0A3B1BZI6_9ZZZZ